jgi:hypothetical protein
LYSPTADGLERVDEEVQALVRALAVAAQVAFESRGLKPDFHFMGSRLETVRFQAMGRLDSTCIAAAASMDPNGSTAPGGAWNPALGSAASAESRAHAEALNPASATLCVAVQVASDSKTLNQDITLQVQGLKPGAFKG